MTQDARANTSGNVRLHYKIVLLLLNTSVSVMWFLKVLYFSSKRRYG